MATMDPGPPTACDKCGESAEPHFWDGTLQLWRAKCSKLFPVPMASKLRKSPHEGFTNLNCIYFYICICQFGFSGFADWKKMEERYEHTIWFLRQMQFEYGKHVKYNMICGCPVSIPLRVGPGCPWLWYSVIPRVQD